MNDNMRHMDKSRVLALTLILLLIVAEVTMGFYEKFNANTPSKATINPSIAIPSIGSFEATIANVRSSVVQVKGPGCGGVVTGSGFVVGTDLVATNAHVIAGVSKVKVIDSNGEHQSTPILVDKDNDLAILRVNNLAGFPLRITALNHPIGQ